MKVKVVYGDKGRQTLAKHRSPLRYSQEINQSVASSLSPPSYGKNYKMRDSFHGGSIHQSPQKKLVRVLNMDYAHKLPTPFQQNSRRDPRSTMSAESNNTSEQCLEPVYSNKKGGTIQKQMLIIEDPQLEIQGGVQQQQKPYQQQQDMTKELPKLVSSVSEFRLQQLPPLQTMITKFASKKLAARKIMQQKTINLNNHLQSEGVNPVRQFYTPQTTNNTMSNYFHFQRTNLEKSNSAIDIANQLKIRLESKQSKFLDNMTKYVGYKKRSNDSRRLAPQTNTLNLKPFPDHDGKILCRQQFCQDDMTAFEPGYHYDGVFSQYLRLKQKRPEDQIRLLDQLKKEYTTNSCSQVFFEASQMACISVLPNLEARGSYNGTTANSQSKLDLPKPPVLRKKIKMVKLKKAKDLFDYIAFRKIVYPEDKKWMGNSRELIF